MDYHITRDRANVDYASTSTCYHVWDNGLEQKMNQKGLYLTSYQSCFGVLKTFIIRAPALLTNIYAAKRSTAESDIAFNSSGRLNVCLNVKVASIFLISDATDLVLAG